MKIKKYIILNYALKQRRGLRGFILAREVYRIITYIFSIIKTIFYILHLNNSPHTLMSMTLTFFFQYSIYTTEISTKKINSLYFDW